jgi:hypothetical protein
VGVIDLRLVALLGFNSLNGDSSPSEEDRGVRLGGGGISDDNGNPSYFLDRNPAWKRLLLDCKLIPVSGGGGMGDESGDCVLRFAIDAARSETWGRVISPVDSSGEEWYFWGVFSNSASVPSSVSSLHLTARLALLWGDFLFLGVKDTCKPFFEAPNSARLRGDGLAGEVAT